MPRRAMEMPSALAANSDIAPKANVMFSFGPFMLGPERQLLSKDGIPVRIGGRALDILTALVERPGELLSKRELMSRVWPTVVVEEDNIKVNMAALRRALGDEAGAARYVATVAGRGYRFIAPVKTGFLPDSLLDNAAGSTRSVLPACAEMIFGRVDAIDAVRQSLDEVPIVSIVGPGGVGKTTIAIAAARAATPESAAGAVFVDLATISDPQFVPAAIASALGLGVTSGDALSSVVHALQQTQTVLLFDNCEHLLSAAAAAADRLAGQVAGIRILATSREPLRVRGERVHRLRGLACDPSERPSAQGAARFPAVELFTARAAERADYRLSDEDAPTVAEICRRLDGNALAIELAATQTAAFSPSHILMMLDDRFRLLKFSSSDAPLRQQSLLATIDWSYSLLSENEAGLLRAISVFAGIFSMDGASAVSGLALTDVAEGLAQLASKSLVVMDAAKGSIFYRLLESTRAYCIERLQPTAEDDAIRSRHAHHICTVLERSAIEWARGELHEWEIAYAHHVDDLRAALAWARRDTTQRLLFIRLTAAGVLLWNHLSLTEECRDYTSEAVAELEAAGQAGTALEMQLQMSLAGNTLFSRGLMPQVMNGMQRALEIAIQIGNTEAQLRCLRTIGACELFAGQHDGGVRTLENCTAVAATAVEDVSATRERENYIAIGELFTGKLQSARQRLELLYKPELRDANDSQLVRFLVYRNVDLGSVLSHTQWLTGAPESAARTAASTVASALKTRYWFSVSNCISWACLIFFLTGRNAECQYCIDKLEEQVLRHGIGVRKPVSTFYRGALACTQALVPEQGIEDLQRGIEGFRTLNFLARMPFYLGVLADALSRSGRVGEAEATIKASLDRAASHNELWSVPESLRIRASMLSARGRSEEAERLLLQSMDIASSIGALSWRLRSAIDLARLWQRSRIHDARVMLASICGEFSEGFSTQDLRSAAQLLTVMERA